MHKALLSSVELKLLIVSDFQLPFLSTCSLNLSAITFVRLCFFTCSTHEITTDYFLV